MNMKKFTSLLIGCSLALAGVALAQQPEEQASPKKEKPTTEKTEKAEAKPGGKGAKPEATVKQTGAMKETGVTNEPSPGKGRKAKATEKSIPDLNWGGNGSLRSTDRQCDTEREAAGGAAQERNEGGWREDIAQCYSGNRGIG